MGSLQDYIKLQPRGVFTVPKNLRKGLFEENNLAKISRDRKSTRLNSSHT